MLSLRKLLEIQDLLTYINISCIFIMNQLDLFSDLTLLVAHHWNYITLQKGKITKAKIVIIFIKAKLNALKTWRQTAFKNYHPIRCGEDKCKRLCRKLWKPMGIWHSLLFTYIFSPLKVREGFPGGSVVKNPPANAGDTGSIPDLGGSHMLKSN